MDNKIFVEVSVPTMDTSYSVFIPVSKRVYDVIILLEKGINELTGGLYEPRKKTTLYDSLGNQININSIIKETNIKNGSKLILI